MTHNRLIIPGRGSAFTPPPVMTSQVDELITHGPNPQIVLDGSNNVQSWTGAAGKMTPSQSTASKRPLWGASPAGGFNGINVVRTTVTNGRCLFGPNGATLYSVFTRPYTCAVVQFISRASGWIYSFEGGGAAQPWVNWPSANTLGIQWTDAGNINLAGFTYTKPLFIEVNYESSPAGLLKLSLNRVQKGTAGGVGNSCQITATRVIIGCDWFGGNTSDSCISFLRLCSSSPPVAERDALYQWAKGTYGLTDDIP